LYIQANPPLSRRMSAKSTPVNCEKPESSRIILGSAVLVLAPIAGWQIPSCELANVELQSDLRDLTAQGGAQIGLDAPSVEEEGQQP